VPVILCEHCQKTATGWLLSYYHDGCVLDQEPVCEACGVAYTPDADLSDEDYERKYGEDSRPPDSYCPFAKGVV